MLRFDCSSLRCSDALTDSSFFVCFLLCTVQHVPDFCICNFNMYMVVILLVLDNKCHLSMFLLSILYLYLTGGCVNGSQNPSQLKAGKGGREGGQLSLSLKNGSKLGKRAAVKILPVLTTGVCAIKVERREKGKEDHQDMQLKSCLFGKKNPHILTELCSFFFFCCAALAASSIV